MSNFTNWLSENGSPSRLLLPPNNLRDSLASPFSVQEKRLRQALSVAFTVLMAMFYSQSSFAQELIINPGFESKLTGWQSNKNPIKTVAATSPIHSGTYAAHINNSTVGDEYFYQNINASPFGKYTFSVWAMVHDITKYSSVGVNVYDANWVKIPAACVEMEVNATAFTQYSKTFTVPVNAKYLQAFGNTNLAVLKVDDYSLTQVVSGTPTGTVGKTCKIENFRNCAGTNVGYGPWLNILIAGAGNGSQNEYNVSALEWKEYSDNTATIKGTITKKSDPTVIFAVDVFLSGRTTAGAGHFSAVDNTSFCMGQKGADWYFYPNAVGTLKGSGAVVGGSQINVTLNPSMPFQVGTGGTTRFKDSFGASAWLELTVVQQPTSGKLLTIGTQGTDFYLEMPGCTPPPIDVCANFTVSGTNTNVTTNGGNNGAVNVKVVGGTSPFTYSWSNGATTQDLTALKAGIYWLTVTDANKCVKTYQAVITQPNGTCSGFRTQTQGGWGSKANGENPGTYRDANFTAAFPSGVTVGCGTKLLKLTTAKAVEGFLPSGSTPSVLPAGTLTNPAGTYSNVLAGQVVALTLNIGFDNYDPAFGSSTINLKNLFISTGTFSGKSVQFLLDEANKALGGCSTTYSLSDINSAVTSINENYDNGISTGNLLSCCNNVTSGGTIGSNQTGCNGFDPALFTSVADPSGGSTNPLEIVWLKSTTSSILTTATASQWTTISGATGLTYDSGLLTQTTYFIRCSRRAGCTDYVGESNVITVTISGNCCSNVTSGGTIAANQSGCSGFDPALFTSVADPSGGSTNPLEIVWLKSTTSSILTTATASQWTTISGATGLTYDSGLLTQTTYFIRCSRRAGCTDYVGESNVITVTISGSCGGKDPVCLSRKTPVLSNLLCGAGTTNYGLFFEDLKGNVPSPSQYFTVKSGELTELCDGTAVLNYTACVNGGGVNDCIKVAVNFSGRTGTPPTGSPVSNTHCTGYSPTFSDWYYYPISSGAFSGTGIYAGLAGGYTQNMGAFQIGTGGGLNEITKFGASSWFKINITNGGTNNWNTVSTKGDINVNLGASTTIASVTASANPISICKGESVALTATIDAASKSANCSPTYSWVGSNGFTSTQATVTNTNVQGATTYTVTVTFTAANGSKCSVMATTSVALNAVCCDNVTNGGQIAASQSGCAPFDPALFTEIVAPSGGSGIAEFVWLKSTTVTVLTAANMSTDWFAVIGANGATLDVGPLTKTTAYIRCSRRTGCSDYVGESNVIIITVNQTPAIPTVTGAAFCGTSTATLTATCTTGSAPNWYTALTGGTAIATGTSYTTPSISSATSYYVTCKSTTGCESTPRVEVKATVNPNPPAPIVTPATSCGSGSVTLGAVCGTGSTAQWYAAATGGNSIATGANYTTVSLSASVTYYVSCKTNSGCESPRVEVKATVIAKITDGGKIQSDENICPSKTPALITSETPAMGGDANLAIEYIWLQTTSLSASGTCPLNIVGQNLYTQILGATSADYQPGVLTQSTCYIRCARRAGCTDYIGGESNTVKKTLLTICQGKDPICLSRKTPVLNTVLCSSTTNYGLYFNDLKGNVPTPSTTYSVKSGEFTEFCDGTAVLSYVACVNGGGVNDCITTTVNFSGRTGTPPAASPVLNTHCSNFMPNVSDWYYYPVSNGVFSGTGIYTGLVGTYAQNMAAFQVGTGGGLNEISKFGGSSWFKINITNGGTNNWTTASKEGDININLGSSTTIASVMATANPAAICSGESVNLTAIIDAASKSANCSPSYSWVGSNGFTSTQATVTNTNVTASTTYTVTVTFTAANGSKCSVTATTGITVNTTPATPTVTPATICGTGTVKLGATCTVGIANWYETATGTLVIATGASFITPSIAATTSYYVSCKSANAGCESARIEVKATINPIPASPSAIKNGTICGTGTVELGAICNMGMAQWYATATGGSVIATGPIYTTPSISTTTSYYVSCKSTEGCESGRTEVKATINVGGTAPTVTPAINCGNGSVTLGAACSAGTPTWYSTATDIIVVATGTSYTTPILSITTSYYVSCKSSTGCESARIEVKATIIAKITDGGTIKADETLCGSGIPAKITSVTPASGGDVNVAIEYIWLKTTSLTSIGACPANIAGQNLYTVIPGSTSADYQPGVITQTTCYIRCARRAGCTNYEGESNTVKKAISSPFTITATASQTSTCTGGTVTITTPPTTTANLTYTWKGPDGFTANTKDVTLANVTLAKSGVYTVTVSNGSCSAVATVQVTITNCLKLGDTVFNDKNNNGKQDVGELNIPNVTVKLYNSANTLIATTSTDPITGKYLFSNLAPDDYIVEIVAPVGYKSSTGTNGSVIGVYEPAGSPNNNIDGDDNGTTTSGQIIRSLPVTLTIIGGDNLTVDFGLFKPASIGDYVFRDLNGDGKQDAGEGGVNGVKVNLYDSANNLVATATTLGDGKYLFDNLIAGNYTVEFVKSTLASGFNLSPLATTTPDKDSDANVTTGKTGTITLTEGQTRTDIDAGVTTPCDTDKTPPVMTACPSDILIKTRGTYSYASWVEPTATDNCGTPIVTTTNPSGSAFPIGSTTVTYTATDAKGNKVTCSFVVNVVKIITCDVDTQAPIFYDCPTDITVSFMFGTKAIVNWDHPSVGDNCGIPSVIYNFEPGQEFPNGTTEVIYTAKDAKGNTSYCKFKINVSFYLVLKTNPTANTTPLPTARVAAASSPTEEVSLENQITLYPNPSNTDFAIELSAELMRANSSIDVKVIGMNGNPYFAETAVGKEAVSMKVSVETMPSGTYFVNVGLDNGRMIIKKLQIIK